MNVILTKTSVIALLAVITAPVFASTETVFFGKDHLSFGSVSEDSGNENRVKSISSHASRIGVKGSIDTDDDIQIIYRLVWQIDITDNSKSSTDHIKSREQYVGLKSDWGEVHMGRDDSPYKLAGKKNIELLSDTWADYNNIIDVSQDTRNDDSIGFWGKIGSAKINLQYAAGDDDPAAENLGESMSAAYDLKVASFGFAVAFQTIEKSITNDETGIKAVIGYTLNDTQIGLISEKVEDDNAKDDKNVLLSIRHNLSNKNSIKFAYGRKDQGLINDAKMTALAYEHKMAKKIVVYALWADGADNGLNDASKLAGDGSVLVAGIIAGF